MRVKFSQTYKKITASFGVDYFFPLPYVSVFGFFSLHEKNITRTPLTIQFATPSKLSISNKINVYSRLVLFRLYASNLAKHVKKITSSFGVDYFLPLPLFNFFSLLLFLNNCYAKYLSIIVFYLFDFILVLFFC